MSAETLERSVLEGKDRDQLIAIATALGLKALSRAKKGDIIDRILEQTGSPNGDDRHGATNGAQPAADRADGAGGDPRRPRAAGRLGARTAGAGRRRRGPR